MPRPSCSAPWLGGAPGSASSLRVARAPGSPRPTGRFAGLRPNPADSAGGPGGRGAATCRTLATGRRWRLPDIAAAWPRVRCYSVPKGRGPSECWVQLGTPGIRTRTRAAQSEEFENEAVCTERSAETAQMQILMAQADEWVVGLQPRHACLFLLGPGPPLQGTGQERGDSSTRLRHKLQRSYHRAV